MLFKRHDIYEDEKTYDLKELVSISKLSGNTIYEKVRKRLIPFHKTARKNGKLYFYGRELNEWDRLNSEVPNHSGLIDSKQTNRLIKAKKSTVEDFENFLRKKAS